MMSESDNWPLVIDLDGTLIKTNSLDETFLDALRADPLALWRLPIQCIIGRPAAKAFLAGKSPLDVETWPVRQDFIDYVEAQFKAGRKVVLASGAIAGLRKRSQPVFRSSAKSLRRTARTI